MSETMVFTVSDTGERIVADHHALFYEPFNSVLGHRPTGTQKRIKSASYWVGIGTVFISSYTGSDFYGEYRNEIPEENYFTAVQFDPFVEDVDVTYQKRADRYIIFSSYEDAQAVFDDAENYYWENLYPRGL